MKNLTFLIVELLFGFVSLSTHAAQPDALQCAKYLSEKQAEAGVEITTMNFGRKKNVPIEINWNYIAYSKLENPSVIAALAGQDASALPEFSRFAARGYSMKKLDQPVCPSCLSQIAAAARGQVAVPVTRQSNQALSLLTPFLAVQFKSTVSPEQIQAFTASTGTSIDAELRFAVNLYALRVRPDQTVTAIEVANAYAKSELVQFAEPTFLETWTYY